jgi:prepilin-type N-terminal cleavage/methylation domain-containing protein
MKKGLRKNKKGFTLVELIIVIAILAILAAVAVPSFLGLQQEAERGRDVGNATAIVTAINAWNALYTDKTIAAASGANFESLKASNLWPKGMGDFEDEAIGRVDFDASGVAVVDTSAAT